MDSRLEVEVSSSVFAVVWGGVAIFYAVCGTFLAYQGAAYLYLLTQALPLLGNFGLLSLGVDARYFTTIGGVFFAIAAVHFYGLANMVCRSLVSRRLVFTAINSSGPPSVLSRVVVRSAKFLSAMVEPMLPPPTSLARRLMHRLVSGTLTLWTAFGVTSPNYGVVYVVRELIQTGIQSYQAYRLSALVARQWMSRIIVLLLVFNCWATPVIQYFVRSSLGRVRLLCLLVNLALDFVSYVVFPVALFLPYFDDFDPVIGNFQQHFWYTDIWLIQIINEWQMLLITSLYDALSKFFIAYNITRSLRGGSGSKLLRALGPHSPSFVTVVPAPKPSIARTPSEHKAGHTLQTDKWRRRIEHLGHRLLGLWGLLILALHIQAGLTGNNDQCLVQVRPWLTTRPVCSLMEINCLDGSLSGNASDFDTAIDSIERDWLTYLIIRDCDAVEITHRIQQLPSLIAVKVFNSTLVSWGVDAALTQTHTPNIIFVFMALIRAQAVPPALYDRDYPQRLYDIELSDWNVTSLPDQVADVWPPGIFLVVEKFQFPSFPEALLKLRPGYLSISFNGFPEIPSQLWDNELLIFLNLNGNPIQQLPAAQPASAFFLFISIIETKIAALPLWLGPSTVVELLAGNTPFCDTVQARNATALGISGSRLHALEGYANCTPASEFSYLTHYPLADEVVNNPPARARRSKEDGNQL